MEETSQRVARARTMNSTQLEFVSQGNLMPKYSNQLTIYCPAEVRALLAGFWRRDEC